MQTHAQTDKKRKQDEAAIKARIDRFVNDFKSGNGEGFADIFSDKYYPPEKKKGLATSIQQMAQYYTIDYEIKVDEIKVDRDMAYEVGSYTSTLTPKAQGETIYESYDFLDVWEREDDGQWRITKAIKTKKEAPKSANTENIPSELAPFVGSYEVNGGVLNIGVNSDNQLTFTTKGQPTFILEAKEKYVYLLKGVPGASITFKPDANGDITGLIFKQVNGALEAQKIKG